MDRGAPGHSHGPRARRERPLQAGPEPEAPECLQLREQGDLGPVQGRGSRVFPPRTAPSLPPSLQGQRGLLTSGQPHHHAHPPPTVSGSPCSACRMKLLTTRPSFMCIRGPKVLKILATRTSTPSCNTEEGEPGAPQVPLLFLPDTGAFPS